MTAAGARRRIGLAELLQERPDEVRSWVKEAPLKLVAAALTDIKGTAKSGAIQEKLKDLLREAGENWKPWWDRVRPAVGDSDFFRIERNKNNAIAAIALKPRYYVSDVPAEPLPDKPAAGQNARAATLTDWLKWFRDEIDEPPGRFPAKQAMADISDWNSGDVEQILQGTMRDAEHLLYRDVSERDAAGWLEALGQASMRWIELAWPDFDSRLAERIAEIMGRLAGRASGASIWPLWAGALSGQLGTRMSRLHEERLERQRESYETQLENTTAGTRTATRVP